MKKLILLLTFFLFHGISFGQDSARCDRWIKNIVKSSSDYKKKFMNNDIFSKKYVSDGYTSGNNYVFAIYYDNDEVGVFNRIATYKLNTHTKQLTSEVLGTERYLPVSYNKKLAADIKTVCKETLSKK